MITIDKKFHGRPFTYEPYSLEKLTFFDIETTGFVADKSFLYLIGCCYYKDGSWRLIQWFAESPTEEELLLTNFIAFIQQYEVCIHYNGTTFDLPYITRKCKKMNLDFSFQNLLSVDLYRTASSLKSLLHLDSCTQKAVEQALSIHREDTFSGGDLIQVYANYIGLAQLEKLKNGSDTSFRNTVEEGSSPVASTADTLLQQLLIHNEEDLIGLQAITSILNYQKLFDGYYDREGISLDDSNRICFLLSLPSPLPAPFWFQESGIEIDGKDTECILRVPLYEGTLNYYIEDYKNYYYLPYEDTLVHKTIAGSMDKNYRVRATKENCFIKKTALFLPQFASIWTPVFQKERKASLRYLECTDERLQDETFLKDYIDHLFSSLLLSKKRKTKDRM